MGRNGATVAQESYRIGLISDTHGVLRRSALQALAGADLVVHAGDVGGPDVLAGLARVAPVRAVRGNVDAGPWALTLPETEVVSIGERILYVLHDLHSVDLDARVAGFDAVVSGHSHRPEIFERGGVLHVNPGSAGPRRFRLPVSVGWLFVGAHGVRAEIVTLGGP